jgi:hypothetical protein
MGLVDQRVDGQGGSWGTRGAQTDRRFGDEGDVNWLRSGVGDAYGTFAVQPMTKYGIVPLQTS